MIRFYNLNELAEFIAYLVKDDCRNFDAGRDGISWYVQFTP